MAVAKIGVLLLQLGTPDAATTPAVRRYLHEFLSDRRVVDLPRALWLPILHLRVLRTRPARSARLYRKIWTDEGSPLLRTTARQAELLFERLDHSHPGATEVAFAMRYGSPSTAEGVDSLLGRGCDRIVAFPMYPQYASATTGSSIQELLRVLAARRVIPAVRVVPPYFDDPAYICALAGAATRALGSEAPDHILMSFHGLPQRHAVSGDPYPDQCQATARAVSAAMGWTGPTTVTFQSRFGREEWLRPYTDEILRGLAAERLGRLVVLCPGFTTDCLETLEEMGITNRELYQDSGGGAYRLLPCLNTDAQWIDAMTTIVSREMSGWLGEN